MLPAGNFIGALYHKL